MRLIKLKGRGKKGTRPGRASQRRVVTRLTFVCAARDPACHGATAITNNYPPMSRDKGLSVV